VSQIAQDLERPAGRMELLRALARRRPFLSAVVLATPAVSVVALDLAHRGDRILGFPLKYLGSYAAAVVEGGVFWALLLACASARRGALRWLAASLFVALATLVVGSQIYFYRQYATWLNLDATLFGTSMSDSLFGQLEADGAHFLLSLSLPLAMALALVVVGRQIVRTRARTSRWLSLTLAPALVAVLVIPCSYRALQGSTPDVLYFHAVGGLVGRLSGFEPREHLRPRRRTPPPLPPLAASPPVPRNVLFVLNESVRFDQSCPAFVPHCPIAPFSNRAAPGRLPLMQMRSNSSTTAIQLAVLWSGLEPDAGREALHDAPLLFDYAHAAGYETAYWTSHHLMFANSRLFVQDLPVRFACGGTHLDPVANIDTGADDHLLVDRIAAELPRLRPPWFAVAHLGNTHLPYLVDDADAPFQPSSTSRDRADRALYANRHKNAIYRQDRAIARLLELVRGLPGPPTVVVYTADHGEQFYEHDQIGHTASLYEEEIHVPAWIDAPAGSLAPAEQASLAAHRDEPTFHTDLAPTILDLLGLWELPALAEHRAPMVGTSLLRSPAPERILALSNCAGVWGCAFQNWGVIDGRRKLIAREWEHDWLCFDVVRDPAEQTPLPAEACADLRAEATRRFGGLPGR
jgi:arylsulfatase A-like enzyme